MEVLISNFEGDEGLHFLDLGGDQNPSVRLTIFVFGIAPVDLELESLSEISGGVEFEEVSWISATTDTECFWAT